MFGKLFLAFCLLLAVGSSSHCSDITDQTLCGQEDHCLWQNNACKCIVQTERDLLFIVDASGSVGKTNFNNAKTWLKNTINTAVPDSSRVGVIRFCSDYTVIHSLGNDQFNQGGIGWSSVLSTITNNMPYTGGVTRTRQAMQLAIDDCQANYLAGREKIIILVTDGIPYPSGNGPCDGGSTIVAQLNANNIGVLVLGIGNFNTGPLSCLNNGNNFISINSYDPNDLQGSITILEDRFCGGGGNNVGDPVVRTLDGMIYEYQGLCSYVLLMDTDNKDFKCKNFDKFNKFKIIGSNKPCELGSCLRRVVVYLKKSQNDHPTRVDFIGYDVLVNGIHVTKRIAKSPYNFGDGKFELSEIVRSVNNSVGSVDVSLMSMNSPPNKQRYVRLETKHGLLVEWNGVDIVYVDLKTSFSGKTCGLLGHRDHEKKNDLRHPDGSVLDLLPTDDSLTPLEESWIVQSFVHHWLHRQSHDPLICKSSTPRKLCDGKKSRQVLVNNMCKGFLSSLASHKNCEYYSSFNDDQKAKFEKRCEHDMCFCYNDDIFSCASYLYSSLLNKC